RRSLVPGNQALIGMNRLRGYLGPRSHSLRRNTAADRHRSADGVQHFGDGDFEEQRIAATLRRHGARNQGCTRLDAPAGAGGNVVVGDWRSAIAGRRWVPSADDAVVARASLVEIARPVVAARLPLGCAAISDARNPQNCALVIHRDAAVESVAGVVVV